MSAASLSWLVDSIATDRKAPSRQELHWSGDLRSETCLRKTKRPHGAMEHDDSVFSVARFGDTDRGQLGRNAWRQTCSTKLLPRTRSENVGLTRRLSSHLSGDRLVESDSYKWHGFPDRKSCFEKRLGISEEHRRRRAHMGRLLIRRKNQRRGDDLMTRGNQLSPRR